MGSGQLRPRASSYDSALKVVPPTVCNCTLNGRSGLQTWILRLHRMMPCHDSAPDRPCAVTQDLFDGHTVSELESIGRVAEARRCISQPAGATPVVLASMAARLWRRSTKLFES